MCVEIMVDYISGQLPEKTLQIVGFKVWCSPFITYLITQISILHGHVAPKVFTMEFYKGIIGQMTMKWSFFL